MTAGVSCGDDCTNIDNGRLWIDFGGDSVPGVALPGVLGMGKVVSLVLHGGVGRGRSSDILVLAP